MMDAREVARPEIIDRQSYEPAYAQLAGILQRQIADGVYRPGDQLPSEAQLCAQFGVSPMTVRRVINILVDKGLVSTAQGKGTFVKPLNLGEATFHLRVLTSQLGHRERTKVRLLEARIISADERAARKLSILPGERAIMIRRLVLEEDIATIFHREVIVYDPRRPVVEAELEVTSLEGLFEGQGRGGLRRGELTIEAVTLNEEEAALLQVPVGSAAFCIEHIFYDFDDRPVSWGWFICRADRFKFRAHLGADPALS